MPFVALTVGAFVLAMFFDKGPSRRSYVLFGLGAIVATIYFLR